MFGLKKTTKWKNNKGLDIEGLKINDVGIYGRIAHTPKNFKKMKKMDGNYGDY